MWRTALPAHSLLTSPLTQCFNVLFTVELLVRFYVADSVKNIFDDVYMYFDCFAVFPFWADVVTGGGVKSDIFELVRALRMLRLLKLARQYQETIILVSSGHS